MSRAIRAAAASTLLGLALTAPRPAGAEQLGPPPPAVPRRVVSLAPSLTDIVVALGRSGRLVGVTRHDEGPEVAHVARVGGGLDPSVEAIVALRPDLVLAVADDLVPPPLRELAALGLPVLMVRTARLADAIAATRAVARALGEGAAGDRLATSLEEAIAAAARRTASRPRLRVLLVVSHEPLFVAGPGSFGDDLLRAAGGENVVRSRRPWPAYPLERAVVDDPALVVDGALFEPPESVAHLGAIPAVRRGDVYRLVDDAALRPGPQLVRGLAELEKAFDAARRRLAASGVPRE